MEKNNSEAIKEDQEVAAGEQDVENESDDASGQNQPDWKELLRIEQDARLKAERDRDNYKEGLLSRKNQERQRTAEFTVTDPEEVDEKIAKGIKEAIQPLAEMLQGNKVDTILASLVKDPAKRDVVKFYFDTKIQRTGTSDDAIKADLELALGIADSKKIVKENSELKRMQDNRVYVPPADGGTADRGVQQRRHQWTPQQEKALEERAMSVGVQDVEKYKERAWQQLQSGTAYVVQKKPKA